MSDSEWLVRVFIFLRGIWPPVVVYILRGCQIGNLQDFCYAVAGFYFLLLIVTLFVPHNFQPLFSGWFEPTKEWFLWMVAFIGAYLEVGTYITSGDYTQLRMGLILFIEAQILLRFFYPLFDDQKMSRRYH